MENTGPVTDKKEKWLLGLLLVLAVLTYRQLITGAQSSTFLPTVVGSFFSYSGTSPQFLYVFVLCLFYIRRKDIVHAFHGKGTPWNAMLYLVPGVCLFLWGHYVGVTDILHMSVLLVGFGAARFLSGKRLTRMIILPVLILVLATPLPGVLLNQIIFPFQLWEAEHSAWLLNAIGVPSSLAGDMIHMAGRNVRVAESCTALGFLKWLTIFALTYTYLFPVSRLYTVILILAAPVIAYMVNITRAFSLALNPKLEVLSIHTAQGVAFFLIGLSLLYAFDSILYRILSEDRRAGYANKTDDSNESAACQKHRSLLVLVSIFLFMFIASFALPRWSSPSADMYKLDLAEELGDWELVATQPVNHSFLASVRYSSSLYRNYMKNNEPVSLFIGYDNRLRRHRSFLSDKNGYQGEMGMVEKHSVVDPGKPELYAESILTGNGYSRFLIYYWYKGVESVSQEILYALLALDQSPFRRDDPALVIRVSTKVEPGQDGLKLAEKRLLDFIDDINTAEPGFAPPKKKGPNMTFGPSPDL